jgi:hypothetical protein
MRATGIKLPTTRDDGPAPNSIGFTVNQSWGVLKRCWVAYRAAAFHEHDEEKAIKYALRIRKLQLELGIAISEFPDLGISGTDPDDVLLIVD